jgi:hypothetical protein
MQRLRAGLFLCAACAVVVGWWPTRASAEEPPPTLAALAYDITNTYSPSILRDAARSALLLQSADSTTALSFVLMRCDELERSYAAQTPQADLATARAYAVYGIATLIRRFPLAEPLLRDNFTINRALGMALVKAEYPGLLPLLERSINAAFERYTMLPDPRELARSCPSLRFMLQSRGMLAPGNAAEDNHDSRTFAKSEDDQDHTIDAVCIRMMDDAAAICEYSRAPRALETCALLLRHQYAFLWQKSVHRAMANLRLSPRQRFSTLAGRLRAVANQESDACQWDWDKPATVFFSLDQMSAEAHLILLLWSLRLPEHEKLATLAPSLNSVSFTARAAVIDCFAAAPGAIPRLQSIVQYRDVNTRRFLALRLSRESNPTANAWRQRLIKDGDAVVVRFATSSPNSENSQRQGQSPHAP